MSSGERGVATAPAVPVAGAPARAVADAPGLAGESNGVIDGTLWPARPGDPVAAGAGAAGEDAWAKQATGSDPQSSKPAATIHA
jgi:hypothetical protein